MKILINDANILIDLIELELLQEFSLLEFEMCTTDFILAEIEDTQEALIAVSYTHLARMLSLSLTKVPIQPEGFMLVRRVLQMGSFFSCSI